MSLDVSGISTWSKELSDRADWIMKPILGGYSMKYLKKMYGIRGNNVLIPTFDSDVLAQGGYACGYTTSGTTTITQKTVTTVPFKINESICLQDLEKIFTVQNLPKAALLETSDILEMWVNRKLQKASQKIGMAVWQGKTTYTNDTWLKLQNGLINDIDAASDEIIVTGGGAGTAITTSNVRTIFEEAFTNSSTGVMAIPQILDKAVAFCGQDTFVTLRTKLMQDNLYHVDVVSDANSAYSKWEMNYPGSTIKIAGIPELNSMNPVEVGSLPTAVKNRIVIADPDNLVVAMNAENDISDFDVWYDKNDDVVKLRMRGFIGTTVLFTDQVVTY